MDSVPTFDEYRQSLQSEWINRDAAFLYRDGRPLTEFIAGFEVEPMNLHHYISLRMAGNPLIYGLYASLPQLVQFIWRLSVEYEPVQESQIRWFERSGLNEPKPPRIPFRKSVDRWLEAISARSTLETQARVDCKKYVEETLADRPPSAGRAKSYYSDACFWCACMGREYGYSIESVMAMPLKQLFQFLNEIKEARGKAGAIRNPSDEILARWQAAQQGKN